jgi:hypothetical protein
MAILVRGRWGIRRWTASPIGRLVTLPLWIPLAALRWDPTGHARLMFGLSTARFAVLLLRLWGY